LRYNPGKPPQIWAPGELEAARGLPKRQADLAVCKEKEIALLLQIDRIRMIFKKSRRSIQCSFSRRPYVHSVRGRFLLKVRQHIVR